jgi:hypothetical protein
MPFAGGSSGALKNSDVSTGPQPELQHMRRQLRIVAMLAAAHDAGLIPLPAQQLHVIAYFADALAPVWKLRILDAQLLKRPGGPMSPRLQRDVDRLVGRGVVTVDSVRHITDLDGRWYLDADYELNTSLAENIIAAVGRFEQEREMFDFVREVVYAMSGLGLLGIERASASDASYGDNDMVDYGGLVDIESLPEGPNPTARIANRFGELLANEVALTPAEMVHLYVRELYKRLERAD